MRAPAIILAAVLLASACASSEPVDGTAPGIEPETDLSVRADDGFADEPASCAGPDCPLAS